MNITLTTGTIGPRHDPYATSLLTVENEGRVATYYRDGLGKNRMTLTSEGQTREIDWFDFDSPTLQLRTKRFKAKLLFKRLVGITLDEAHALGLQANYFGHEEKIYGHP